MPPEGGVLVCFAVAVSVSCAPEEVTQFGMFYS